MADPDQPVKRGDGAPLENPLNASVNHASHTDPSPGLRHARRDSLRVPLIFFILLALIALAPLFRLGDFPGLYTGGRLAFTGNLYSVDKLLDLQREFTDSLHVWMWVRPPFYAVFLWPLGLLPYKFAVLLWQAVNLAALWMFWRLWSGHPLGLLISCAFVPLIISFIQGQDLPLLLLCLAASAYSFRQGRPRTAGFFASLCAIKFHLFLFLPVMVITRRDWSFLRGFLFGAALLVVLSFVAGGRSWPVEYYQAMVLNEGLIPRETMPTLGSLLQSIPLRSPLLALAAAAAVIALWFGSRRSPPDFALSLVAGLGIVFSPHAYIYDCALLLPLLLSLARLTSYERLVPVAAILGLAATAVHVPNFAALGQLSVAFAVAFALYAAGRLPSLPAQSATR